jgi:hypothetical protein
VGSSDYSAVGDKGLLGAMIEDTNDLFDNYEVGPNWGGQNYDAEFLGLAQDNGRISIAILSGQRYDNGQSLYAPGDIRITTGSGQVIGVEVGGGWLRTSGALHASLGNLSPGGESVVYGERGVTYKLDSHGFTIGASDGANGSADWGSATHNAAQTAGSLWVNANWIDDPIIPPTPTQLRAGQISGGSGTRIDLGGSGNVEFMYRFDGLGYHSVIEFSADASLFEAYGGIVRVDWSPSCGNDTLSIVTPEPASLAAWGLFPLVGLLAYRRRRRLAMSSPARL